MNVVVVAIVAKNVVIVVVNVVIFGKQFGFVFSLLYFSLYVYVVIVIAAVIEMILMNYIKIMKNFAIVIEPKIRYLGAVNYYLKMMF